MKFRKLYLSKDTNKFENVKELVDCFFSIKLAPATYYKNGNLHTRSGASRSFGDVLRVCLTYFPETTPEEVAFHFLNRKEYYGHFCNDVKKPVYHYYVYEGGFNDNTKLKGVSQYSHNDVVKLSKKYKK